ncbi:MAG: hypothetical protein NUW37_17650 [Planctomycetes bacterium]|nr:hypothetical protein [Planctomycetota bacterium]
MMKKILLIVVILVGLLAIYQFALTDEQKNWFWQTSDKVVVEMESAQDKAKEIGVYDYFKKISDIPVKITSEVVSNPAVIQALDDQRKAYVTMLGGNPDLPTITERRDSLISAYLGAAEDIKNKFTSAEQTAEELQSAIDTVESLKKEADGFMPDGSLQQLTDIAGTLRQRQASASVPTGG